MSIMDAFGIDPNKQKAIISQGAAQVLPPHDPPPAPILIPPLEKISVRDWLASQYGDADAQTEGPGGKVTFDDPPSFLQHQILESLVRYFQDGLKWGLTRGIRFTDFRILWSLLENKLMPGQFGGREQTPHSFTELHVAFQANSTGRISLHDSFWVQRSPGPTAGVMIANALGIGPTSGRREGF